MALEAYVKISEVLKDAPALTSVSTEFLVAGAIKSRYGRFDVGYYTNRADLLRDFTCEGKLDATADVSLINAYEVLASAPILVCRAAADDYEPTKIAEATDPKFRLVFRDFMSDSRYKVSYDIKKSEIYPGAIDILVKYLKDTGIYNLALGRVSGTAPEGSLGTIITLNDASGNSIKVKVLKEGALSEVTDLELVTETSIANSTTYSGSGIQVELSVARMDPELIKKYELTVGLDKSVVDNVGNSLYYENLWTEDIPFTLELTGISPTEVTIPNPYKESDPTQPDTLTYLDFGPATELTGELARTIDAVNTDIYDNVYDPSGKHWSKFQNYEDRQIPIFSDFGTPNVGSNLKTLAEQFYGMYLVSLPRLSESVAGARSWEDLDLGNSRRYACTPFALTNHLGFSAPIAPTTQYIATLCINKVSGNEFVAVAGKETGAVSYSNLTKNYNKSDRQSLLDLKINTITYRQVDGYAMFNDDLTGLVKNNPFKEEFNRRLGVRIAQDIDTLMKQFLFKLNTASLRDTVTSTIETYFKTSPFIDKIWAYEVVCNDENNPPSLQAQNKLAVKVNIALYYTAKYIEVVNNIYSVGQSFNE